MKFKEAIKKGIRWDLTPELSAINEMIESQEDLDRVNKRIKEQAGYYFYIDIWNCSPSLAIGENDETGGGSSHIIEDPPITEEEMVAAVEDAGGAINMSGWYPISQEVEDRLKGSHRN